MVADPNIHWTDDDELLSKYVLRQLPDTEESSFTTHLSSCERCRNAVHHERLIAVGTKLAVRRELKHRLRSLLAFRNQQALASAPRTAGYSLPWFKIAGFAAAATVIVVVGVYNNWFTTDYRDTRTIPDKIAQEHEQPNLEAAREAQKRKEGSDLSMQESMRNRDVAQSQAEVAEGGSKKRESNSANHETGEGKGLQMEEKPQPAIVAAPAVDADSRVSAAKESKSEVEARTTDQAMIPPHQAFWVDAHVVAFGSTLEESKQERFQRPVAGQDALTSETEKTAGKQLQNQQVYETSPTFSNVLMAQKPVSSLPPALQLRRNRSGVVPTFIETRDDSILLTLYLNSPVSDSSLRSENVESIGNDSLILHLPNQDIGLRLPAPLVGQVKSKTNR